MCSDAARMTSAFDDCLFISRMANNALANTKRLNYACVYAGAFKGFDCPSINALLSCQVPLKMQKRDEEREREEGETVCCLLTA